MMWQVKKSPIGRLSICASDFRFWPNTPTWVSPDTISPPEVRSHAIPNTRYIIFYFPKDYGVEVARVAHGSQNLHRLFE